MKTIRFGCMAAAVAMAAVLANGCAAQSDEENKDDTKTEETKSDQSALLSCPGRAAFLFEDVYTSGRYLFRCAGEYNDLREFQQNLMFFDSWNDRISSFTIVGGATWVYACEDIYFQGRCRWFYTQEIKDLRLYDMNDKISSIKIY